MKRYLTVYAAAAYLFLYAPLLVLGAFSFNNSKLAIWRGFTWRWYCGMRMGIAATLPSTCRRRAAGRRR